MSAYRKTESLRLIARHKHNPGSFRRNLAVGSAIASGLSLVLGGAAIGFPPASIFAGAAVYFALNNRSFVIECSLLDGGPDLLILRVSDREERLIISDIPGYQTHTLASEDPPDVALTIHRERGEPTVFLKSHLGPMFSTLERELQKRCFR